MVNKNFIYFFLLIFLYSCTDKECETFHYPNGKLRKINCYDDDNNLYKSVDYYSNGIIKAKKNINDNTFLYYNKSGILIKKIFLNDSINGTLQEYYSNGNLKLIGPILKKNRHGWFNIYDSLGKVEAKKELLHIGNKEVLNQVIAYNYKGDIDYTHSDFFTLTSKDTFPVGRSICTIKYTPKLSSRSIFKVYVGYDIRNDFSNLNVVKLDTFISNNQNDIWFGIKFKDVGNKIIRGVFEEEYYEPIDTYRKLTIKRKRFYFEKKVVIKNND